MSKPVLEMLDINKNFPGVKALDQCRFDLYAGEVHALIGENGAGKSTMMKILAGIYQKDSGQIILRGKEVHFHTPKDAQRAGIGLIHQELNLIRHLTVAQNIFIGHEPHKGPFVLNNQINQETRTLLDSLHLNLDEQEVVSSLSVAQQQMVEIAKAIHLKSEIIVMDEPTAALSDSEIKEIFRFIEDLKAKKHAIVYISHRMPELFRISDRITVMRDGQYIQTLQTGATSPDELIRLMVGRTICDEPKSAGSTLKNSPVVLEVKNLCSPCVKNVSLSLRKGEILGLAGLMGAGRTETARLIFGADKLTSGSIFVKGNEVSIRRPRDAVTFGIGYLSEDRKRYGLATGLSVRENATLASMKDFFKSLIIDSKKEVDVTEDYVRKLNIKTPTIQQLLRNLSGGNQQKVVIAKWLIRDCDILIFDEPTRGIDVGAKNEIYQLMTQLVDQGKSILMISSELPELIRMSDRIAVMCEGALTGILPIEEVSQEAIMQLATAQKERLV